MHLSIGSRRPSAAWLIATLALSAPLLSAGCQAQNLRPLDSAPIHRERAKGAAPVHIELMRVELSLNADGTYVRKDTQRYRIVDQSGVENWGHAYAYFAPWYMERPVIEGKVINPDKTVALDPSQLSEHPAYPQAPDIYGDSLVVRGPYPSVHVGSVIEETVTIKTHRPFLHPAHLHFLTFASNIPKDRVEFIIDAPAELPLKFEVRDANVEQSKETKGDRKILRFVGGPYEAFEDPEPMIPVTEPFWPEVALTTGTDWGTLAAVYEERIEKQLAGVDFASTVNEVVDKKDSKRDKARKLHAWVKGHVRYVGVEFGESSVIPYAPDQVVSRGYGDCKDQATLLVGLLRAAGIDASVALLRAGTAEDVVPELPALNVFNHAIVRAKIDGDVWIDPTADLLDFGALPTGDRGRFALVASSMTNDLTRTPLGTPDDNTYSETKIIRFAEEGPASLVEKSTATGTLGSRLRANFTSADAEVREGVESYIERTYDAEELGKLEYSDPFDLLSPFHAEIEAKKAEFAETNLLTASSYVREALTLAWIPDPLRGSEDEERKSALIISEPHQVKLTWIAEPPSGFVVDEYPEPLERQLGGARSVRTVEKKKDESVVVTTRFALESGLLSPEEVKRFRDDYDAWANSDAPYVTFEHRSQKLLEEDRVEEAFALLQKEANATKNSGLGQMRMGYSLRPYLFEEAREHAKQGASEGAKDAERQAQLCDLLALNRVGDDLDVGFDRKGALTACRRAVELDDENVRFKLRLATILETDEEGDRYESDDLAQALEVYASIPEKELREFEGGGFERNSLFTLYWAEKYDELHERLARLPTEEIPKGLAVMNEAARTSSFAAAKKEAERLRLEGGDLVEALHEASRVFVNRRAYDQANEALDLIVSMPQASDSLRARRTLVGKAKKIDLERLKGNSPEVAAKAYWTYSITRPSAETAWTKKWVAQAARSKGDESALMARLLDRDYTPAKGIPPEVFSDLVFNAFQTTKEGSDDHGYRVKLSLHMGGKPSHFTAYVIREGGMYRYRGLQDEELGAQALAFAQAGKDEAAARWLDWAREDFRALGGEDPLRVAPYARLWSEGKGDALLAAAALAVGSDASAQATSVLERALAKETDAERRQILQHALTEGYRHQEKYDKYERIAKDLYQALPDSKQAFWIHADALFRREKYADYKKQILLRQKKDVDGEAPVLIRKLSMVEGYLGNLLAGMKVRESLLGTKDASADDYNEQAWDSLFVGTAADHLETAEEAVRRRRDTSYLHTLATLQAELGKLKDAMETIQEVFGRREDHEPSSADHYVLGLIAERLGYEKSAKEHYRRVEKPEFESPTSTYVLAKKRLGRL